MNDWDLRLLAGFFQQRLLVTSNGFELGLLRTGSAWAASSAEDISRNKLTRNVVFIAVIRP
jgi:hypothetical protein